MINKSESIDKLAEALSGLQGEMQDVYKSSTGYGYNYADLASVFEVIRPLCRKYGLSISQPVSGSNQSIEVNTILMHSSGQYISSSVSVQVDLSNKKMNSLQAAGSTITYLRRYCICSIVGIATTDDDGKSGGESIEKDFQQRSSDISRTPHTNKSISHVHQPSQEEMDTLLKRLMIKIEQGLISVGTVDAWCAKANVQGPNQFNYKQLVYCLSVADNNGEV